jgi:hypothetical protein
MITKNHILKILLEPYFSVQLVFWSSLLFDNIIAVTLTDVAK